MKGINSLPRDMVLHLNHSATLAEGGPPRQHCPCSTRSEASQCAKLFSASSQGVYDPFFSL